MTEQKECTKKKGKKSSSLKEKIYNQTQWEKNSLGIQTIPVIP